MQAKRKEKELARELASIYAAYLSNPSDKRMKKKARAVWLESRFLAPSLRKLRQALKELYKIETGKLHYAEAKEILDSLNRLGKR